MINQPSPESGAAPEPHGTDKAGRGTIYLLTSQLIALAGGFVISLLLARVLGPEQFGIYGVVMSVLIWFERVLAAGIPGATAMLLPRQHGGTAAVEQAAKVLLIAWSLVLFTLCWSLAGTISNYLGIESGARLFRLASLDIPLMSLYFAYDGILNGKRQFAGQSYLLVIQSMTKLGGVLVMLWVGLSVTTAFVAHVVATFTTAAYVLARYPIARRSPSATVITSMTRLALPLGGYQVALGVLMSLSLWQLQADPRANGYVVGLFVAALNLTRMFLMVPSAVTGVMYASLSWALARGDEFAVRKYVRETVRFALIMTAPACILLMTASGGIMALLFGEEYREGANILAILCIAYGGVAFFDIFFHMLMAAGRVHVPVAVLVGMLPALVALNFWLIAASGGDGAAIAFAVDILAGVAIGGLLAYRHFGGLLGLKSLFRVGLACLIIAIPAWYFDAEGMWLIFKLGALALLYGIVLFATRELGWSDLEPFGISKVRLSMSLRKT